MWLLRSVPQVTPASTGVALELLSMAANRQWTEPELHHDLTTLAEPFS